MLKQWTGILAIFGGKVDNVRLATGRSDRFVFAVIGPIGRTIDAATVQLTLYIVPGHNVIDAGPDYGPFQRVFQHHLQIGFEYAGGNANGQLNDKDDGQQDGKL